MLMRCMYDGEIQTVMEKYNPNNDEWEFRVPTFRRDKEVYDASLLPWHFFVYHKNSIQSVRLCVLQV